VKPDLLLHYCCAPCAGHVIELLLDSYDLTLFFYNPNIEPFEEYIKRKNELSKLIKQASYDSDVKILDCEYDNAVFINAALSLRKEPEGGLRCRECFKIRLSETAKRAAEGEYDYFTTTLSVSPHKDAKILNELGLQAGREYDIKYFVSDFKKNGGYNRSVELSKEYELYRQNYCGCISRYSELD